MTTFAKTDIEKLDIALLEEVGKAWISKQAFELIVHVGKIVDDQRVTDNLVAHGTVLAVLRRAQEMVADQLKAEADGLI